MSKRLIRHPFIQALLARLIGAAAALPPAQRPRQWLPCAALAPNAQGKWDRAHWRRWARAALRAGR